MKYVKMNCQGNYRGQDYTPDTILEVSDSLYDNMILAGKGIASSKEMFDGQSNRELLYSEMTLDELSKIDFSKLKKEPLVEFASACGVEVDDEKMKEICELIVSATGFGDDE